MRLRELGISVGNLEPGEGNAITDVPGVRVGHVDIVDGRVSTGITAVVPYSGGAHRVFAGRFSVDGGDGMTGLGVTEDFGAIAAPIVLAPAASVGRVYDALIGHGQAMDPGLPEDAGWPPVVIGVDDSAVNPPALVHRLVREEHLHQALAAASGRGEATEGSVGIGRGLTAFGGRGGVGTSSRRTARDSSSYAVGALVAANGGEPDGLNVDGFPVGASLEVDRLPAEAPRGVVALVATDAPLIPRQLDRLASRAALGLARLGILDASTREGIVLAVSTTGLDDGGKGSEAAPTRLVSLVGEAELPELFAAAAEACAEAVINGLLEASPAERAVGGAGPGATLRRPGVDRPLPTEDWPEEVRRFQRERGRRR